MIRKYYHRPFRSHRKRNTKHFILAVIVIAVVVFVLVKTRKSDTDESLQDDLTASNQQQPTENEIEDIQNIQTEQEKDTLPPEPKTKPETETVQLQPVEPQQADLEKQPDQTETPADLMISNEAKALIAEALEDINAGRIIAARVKLNEALTMDLSPQVVAGVKAQMQKLSEKWLFSRDRYPEDTLTEIYEVQPNDHLADVVSPYMVPWEIILKINNIPKPEALQIGQKIKLIRGPFHAIVHRSTFTMDLYLQQTYVKTYNIGLGEEGKETPTGLWKVKANGKLIQPPWPRPAELGGGLIHPEDPEYPLGSRWIGLDGIEGDALGRTGFGIHGTKDPETIGTRSSRGCVRLYNGDAIELYDLLVPVQSKVRIID